MKEVEKKINLIRKLMEAHALPGVRFKGVDWFSWATCGANSVVIFTSEVGVAEVFITHEKAFVLTSRIERDRLVNEEIPKNFEVVEFPWEDPKAMDQFVRNQLRNRTCASDRPGPNEMGLPWSFCQAKMVLSPDEITRYRQIATEAAAAMTESIQKARPEWTEQQLAAEGARSLWARGIDPTLVMVGSYRRIQVYRHPIATQEKIGEAAMMVFCGRKLGLYANLTRFVFFRELTSLEKESFQMVGQIEAMAFNHSKPSQSLASIYHFLAEAYKECGHEEEIHRHHQGGITGYLSREQLASPELSRDIQIEKSMALAWNPSLPGAKIEDTVLVTDQGCEILTVDPAWPTLRIDNRLRPDVLIKA